VKRPIDTRNEPLNELVPPELVDRCKAGDQRAWAELVDATHREVYTLCLRILRDPDEAAEATQDTFVKVWRSLAGFRGDAAFTTWLYRVAANTAISRHRSRARKRSHEFTGGDEMLTAVASTSSTEAEAASRIDVQQLEQNLEMLPEHYRSAIVLRDVYGWSIEEIAKELKISNTAAKVRVHRGRKKLREMTFPEVGDDR
jgi:RNA polymerase sigma-70 factor (ECF subfamily)